MDLELKFTNSIIQEAGTGTTCFFSAILIKKNSKQVNLRRNSSEDIESSSVESNNHILVTAMVCVRHKTGMKLSCKAILPQTCLRN